ncbi:hypothetical protein GTR02_06475 [Kineococcus sp. R8]|uniref:hypothetical protein n=1 Tax=Kineococcus siccus TaxID=2696567 RepID=UPI001411C0CA|nr:hypothetical protein [Kineococcus siccus]NAZ81459.1 hypothetical protein [Kineococcus siccus]
MVAVRRVERAGRRRDVVVALTSPTQQPPAWCLDATALAAEVHLVHGPDKWVAVADLLRRRPDLAEGEGTVWIPDADVSCSAEVAAAVFALHEELGLLVSHPALAAAGWAAHPVTRPHGGFAVRLVDHVEATAPLFDRAALDRVAPTFGSGAGPGLPHAWRVLLGGAARLAVLDCLVVTAGAPRARPAQHAATALAVEHGAAVPCAPQLRGGWDVGFSPLAHRAALELSLRHLLDPQAPQRAGAPGSDDARYVAGLRTDLALATREV